ncbi:unnamed protein product [Closterium sp. NIES-64]|nr:unnamed protein product [Closterium sp. NIES-64]
MDFLGALGRDCTAESDPAPRPLPPARPAASLPISPPESADQIRHRFEDQQREQARRAGRSLSPPEPLRAGSILRSGAEAVALQECSPRRRSSAARDDKWESHRDDRHGAARSPLSPRSPRRVAWRSRSRDRRSHCHCSPPHRSSHHRSPCASKPGAFRAAAAYKDGLRSQLADSALALRMLVAGPGTPVDVVGATVSVVRQLWLNTSGMLAAVEADRM